VVGLVGLAIAAGFALRVLAPHGLNPTIFLALGEDSHVQTSYARDLLGDVVTRPDLGHDGRFFFPQANDPWYLDPQMHAAVLDRPVYRGQRMLFPMLAGGFGLFPPHAVAWAMLITNVVAFGLGTLLAARLAQTWGASPWLGLAIPLNIGLIFELDIGGAGVLAYVLCVAAVCSLSRGREWPAATLLAGAALSREVMLLFAAGLLVVYWLREHRFQWRLLALPLIAIGIWHIYLRIQLEGVVGAGGGREAFAPPFVGMWQAFMLWAEEPADLFLGVTMLAVVVVFTLRAFRSRQPLAWGALPFVALATTLSVYVWREPVDLFRALAPVFTAYAFILFAKDDAAPSSIAPVESAPSERESADRHRSG
jgi:hypothetical protein